MIFASHTTVRRSRVPVSLAGFTLIELLVVIAIIGILAAVVLASLDTAKGKGADAAAQSDLNNARGQAELFYDNQNNTYANICTATNGINAMLVGAQNAENATSLDTTLAGAGGVGIVNCHVNTNGAGWAAATTLKVKTSAGLQQYYCIDSNGTSKKTTTALVSNSVTCP